jgi:predicted O-methyltransferase YrrM
MPPLGKKVDRESPCMTLDDYSTAFSSPLPSVYSELILNTKALIPSGSHMLSGGVQGRLLTQLASMTREGRVLEIGTFSGYGTACLLEGTINLAGTAGGKLGSRIEGPYVMTMERDVKAFQVAVNHLRVLSSQGFTEASAKELSHLRYPESAITLSPRESLVSLNCVDVSRCELVLVSDALAAVEQMAAGQGELVPGPFDLVFLDADKTRLLEYVDVFLSSDLLKRGGIIVVDNVLYKGLVLEASRGEFVSLQDGDDATDSELRRNRRQRRLAKMMHRFNEAVVQDVRAEVIVLPLRDGLTVIRKK